MSCLLTPMVQWICPIDISCVMGPPTSRYSGSGTSSKNCNDHKSWGLVIAGALGHVLVEGTVASYPGRLLTEHKWTISISSSNLRSYIMETCNY